MNFILRGTPRISHLATGSAERTGRSDAVVKMGWMPESGKIRRHRIHANAGKNGYNGNNRAAHGCFRLSSKRRHAMGEKGSKKDKEKAQKQKQQQLEKKKEQNKSKLPAKKPA